MKSIQVNINAMTGVHSFTGRMVRIEVFSEKEHLEYVIKCVGEIETHKLDIGRSDEYDQWWKISFMARPMDAAIALACIQDPEKAALFKTFWG